MMSTTVLVMSGIGAFLGLVGIVASVYAYYSMNLSKAQIEALRGDRDDQEKRIKRLESEEARLRKERDILLNRVDVLQGLVTHDAKIQELIQTVSRHDANVEEKFSQNMKSFGELIRLVNKLIRLQEGASHA